MFLYTYPEAYIRLLRKTLGWRDKSVLEYAMGASGLIDWIIDNYFPLIDFSSPFSHQVVVASAFWIVMGLALETTHLVPRLHRVFDALFIIAIILVGVYVYHLYSAGDLYPEKIKVILFRVLPYLIPFSMGAGLASLILRRRAPPKRS